MTASVASSGWKRTRRASSRRTRYPSFCTHERRRCSSTAPTSTKRIPNGPRTSTDRAGRLVGAGGDPGSGDPDDLDRRPRRRPRYQRRERLRAGRVHADVPRLPRPRGDARPDGRTDPRARRAAGGRSDPRRLLVDRPNHARGAREAARVRLCPAGPATGRRAAARSALEQSGSLPLLRLDRHAPREHLRAHSVPLAALLRQLSPALRAVQDHLTGTGEPLVPPWAPSLRLVAAFERTRSRLVATLAPGPPLRSKPPAGRSPAPAAIRCGSRGVGRFSSWRRYASSTAPSETATTNGPRVSRPS